ncbi:saccharopine dehydrogenase NADP-binding domain-containing protein [Alkalicaulis satelles]|nr:saccharopine dehydrogenase NADP-binding domain-containing protein [Alkalicaulis satelles]
MVKQARHTVMVLGSGVIGGQVADLLSRMDNRYHIILASRTLNKVNERANLTITSAMCLGLEPKVDIYCLDVQNIDQTASLISSLSPDLIINATSLQPFWAISLLEKPLFQRLQQARIGPWLPNHLATARTVMLAVAASGSQASVINAAFPDVVNPALHSVGLAPLVGAGNIANLIPSLQRACEKIMGAPRDRLSLRFAAHHAACNEISSTGRPDPAPYALSLMLDGREASSDIQHSALFKSVVDDFRRVRGIAGQIVAASNVVAVAVALLDERNTRAMHAPGPHGLPGGYPVRIGKGGVSLDCIGGFGSDEAISVNEAGAVVEGIEAILPDGTIIFTDQEMTVLKNEFGYYCKKMHVNEASLHAEELQSRYQSYIKKSPR